MKRIGVLMLILIVFVWVQQSRPQTADKKRPTDSNLILVDSTGKTIGSVIGVFGALGATVVAFPLQGNLLPVEVSRSSFYHGWLFFTSSDCTGQPFVDESNSPFPASAVAGPGDTLYVAGGPSQSIVAPSASLGGGCYVPPRPYQINDAVPMKPAVNLNDMFTPPFKVVSQKEREKEKEEE